MRRDRLFDRRGRGLRGRRRVPPHHSDVTPTRQRYSSAGIPKRVLPRHFQTIPFRDDSKRTP
jgi:hypothetical protein